ncbi:MAG: GWxTD domain-containing protein [Candidatus Aminicenantales bacterium]
MTIFGRCLRIAALITIALGSACATTPAMRSLDSESRDFISKVRFIITKQERQRLLATPAGDRNAFIEEFWKKRDPNPATAVNEFKEQYFARIAEANHLFNEGGEPGWLQDRGRIYILLGPPTNRFTYPRGVTFYDVPREYWYYGFFVILFTDEAWNGNYKLDPLSVEQISMINRAQMEWQPQISAGAEEIEFDAKTEKTADGRGLVTVVIPYRVIPFDAEAKALRARFIITLDLLAMDGTEIRQMRSEHALEMTEEEMRRSSTMSHIIEIPVEAPRGHYWVRLTLESGNDGAKAYKRIKLSI